VVQHTDETCALDIADQGQTSVARVAELLGVDEDRVRQIEEIAKESAKELLHLDHHEHGDCLPGCVWCAASGRRPA
jgi:predicted glycoside hydrolase/deacetylase ChbG (UPF0249 family)